MNIKAAQDRRRERQLRRFLDRLGRSLASDAEEAVDGRKLEDNNSYTLRRLLDKFNLILGVRATDALMRNRIRWTRRPLRAAILAAQLVMNLTWMWTSGGWWLKIGGILAGLAIWMLGMAGTERREKIFGLALCAQQTMNLEAWPKKGRIRMLRKYVNTLPANSLAPSGMRPDILEALQVRNPVVVGVAETLTNEYYGGAKDLLATVTALLD